MRKIFVINGPNMNFLGIRQPEIYGTKTLGMINESIKDHAQKVGADCEFYQYNSEGSIIDCLQKAHAEADGVILNAGAFTHYSYAISDCIASIRKPVVEVHLTNLDAREEYRKTSVIGAACIGSISGFGNFSYIMALDALMDRLNTLELEKEKEKK